MWACSRASRPTSWRTSSGSTILRRCSGPAIHGPAWSADRGVGSGEGGCRMDDVRDWPACRKCQQGLLIPLSDYGRDGAPITYKAWVCSNPDCGFNIRVANGEFSFGREHGQSLKLRWTAPADP